MKSEEAVQEIINHSNIDFSHICVQEFCIKCYRSSCICKYTITQNGNVTNYHCPHCGSVRMTATITTSSTSKGEINHE